MNLIKFIHIIQNDFLKWIQVLIPKDFANNYRNYKFNVIHSDNF